ncbi:MAG: cellulase family glycosylhydrolase, partial [Planctomycetaceae bacterium]|nr:cellulase family glycosylhydrolase [Planctomycetaceae bacterium]
MKKIFEEKYLYLLVFLLVAIGYSVQMVTFSRFLSDTRNFTVYTAWTLNQELRREIHDHPERYPEYNPDGTRKLMIVDKKIDADTVVPEISNAFTLYDRGMSPFKIRDVAKNSITNISSTLDKPAGRSGFIRVKDGHFYNDKGRFQIAGINNTYAANFPTHDDAEVTALKLARFGFNCVRLHHCDEKGFWSGNKTIFDENKLELFDYNVAVLKKQGIYVNLNLHCSRYLGHNEGVIPSGVLFDKGIDNFDTSIRDLNKKFAFDLLNHVNPYTGNAYKDEPAVAMIEINNENSICQIWRNGSLEKANEYYLHELRDLWNAFLKERYGNDENLRKEVGFETIPLGDDLLKGTGAYVPKRKIVRLADKHNNISDPQETALENTFVLEVKGQKKDLRQLVCDGLSVKKGQLYTFFVTMRTDVPSSVLLRHVFSNKKGRTVKMYTQGKFETYTYTFIADRDDNNFRLGIGGFLENVLYQIQSLSFREGGSVEYPKMDDRPVVLEESFDVYTTSLVNNKLLKTLATINLQKILDGQILQPTVDLELRARANRKYRIDMLVKTAAKLPIAIMFQQQGKTLTKKENYNSFEKPGNPYILSYTVESQSNDNIALIVEDKQRSMSYTIDILQVKPVAEQSNETISLDSMNIPVLFYSLISRYPAKL